MCRAGRSCQCRCHLAAGAVTPSLLPLLQVGFQCEIPRELFLRLFPTAAFEAPQTELEINKEAFVQVLPASQCPGWGSPGLVTLMVCPTATPRRRPCAGWITQPTCS